MSEYIGFLVEIDCLDDLHLIGTITRVDKDNLSLKNVFHNNKPYHLQEIVLRSKDMKSLKILESPTSESPPLSDIQFTYKSKYPSSDMQFTHKSKYGHSNSIVKPVVSQSLSGQQDRTNKVELVTNSSNQSLHTNNGRGGGSGLNYTYDYLNSAGGGTERKYLKNSNQLMSQDYSYTNKQSQNKKQQQQFTRNNECFGITIDNEILNTDFDFEENLKLFDKISLKNSSNSNHTTSAHGKSSAGTSYSNNNTNKNITNKIGNNTTPNKNNYVVLNSDNTTPKNNYGITRKNSNYNACITSVEENRNEFEDSDTCDNNTNKRKTHENHIIRSDDGIDGESMGCMTRPDIVQQVDIFKSNNGSNKKNKQKKSYRHDENVIQGDLLWEDNIEQIKILKRNDVDSNEGYVTDTGLHIPCISVELKKKILNYAEDVGLSFERQNEIMGRAATEMTLQLIGGAHRLKLNNRHQWPKVVLMAGSHKSGAMCVNTARQLASHDITTILYLHDPDLFTAQVAHELALYRLTGNQITDNIMDIPTEGIDLIISGLSTYESDSYIRRDVINYIKDQRVPIFNLDPNKNGLGSNLVSKYCLTSVLPLAYNNITNGKVYLCNYSIPNCIFKDFNVQYRSPFGAKFVIPLYSK